MLVVLLYTSSGVALHLESNLVKSRASNFQKLAVYWLSQHQQLAPGVNSLTAKLTGWTID